MTEQLQSESEKVVRLPKKQERKSKRDKFQEIVKRRLKTISKALDVLASVGRNQSGYDYSQRDVDKIIKVLTDEVEMVRIAMIPRERREPTEIRFDD